jgi:thiamine-phosphate pyrophosphorylase
MSYRKTFDLYVYFIADPSVCAGRAVEDVVHQAVLGGATMIQLRDKSGDMDQVERNARAIQKVLSGTGVPFLVNDYVAIAAKIGSDGLHIGQDDIAPREARKIIGEYAILGLTAFAPEHFSALDPAVVDYAGTGPFYGTLTKPDKPVLGADGFAALVKLSPVPVVGIGGITADNAQAVIRAGAKGVAMMRSISEADDPREAAHAFKTIRAF